MSTADNKRSVIVGIFILLGIIIFITAVFTLAGKQKKFVKSITLKAIFDDVAGLKNGNNIWFSGVKVGTVKDIDFYGDSKVLITMKVEEEAQKYIHTDAKAKISSEGFIGNKIIVITPGSSKMPMVQDGETIHTEIALSTDQMMETFQENNKNLLVITNNFKQLSDKIKAGKGTVGAVLTDSVLADNFRKIVANLNAASQNAVQVSGTLNRFSARLNRKGTLANELTTDTTVFSGLKASVAKLREATTSATEMVKNFEQTSQKLKSDKNAVGVLLNDEDAGADLKSTLKNLEASTEKLDENMEALQHNFFLRGFFRKKAKEEAEKKKAE